MADCGHDAWLLHRTMGGRAMEKCFRCGRARLPRLMAVEGADASRTMRIVYRPSLSEALQPTSPLFSKLGMSFRRIEPLGRRLEAPMVLRMGSDT